MTKYECEGQLSLFDILESKPETIKPVFFKIPSAYLGYCPVCKNEVYFRPINFSDEDGNWWNPIDGENKGKKRCGVCNTEFGKDAKPPTDLETVSGITVRDAGYRRISNTQQPKPQIKDDYIRENPTCFYVLGHYLDSAQGWHKVPEELPNFTTWQLIDVVLFGKQTGTAWMEHEKWEAKDWSFRSVDDRRNTETTEVLAWKLSKEEVKQCL